jgi:hypothetical protein
MKDEKKKKQKIVSNEEREMTKKEGSNHALTPFSKGIVNSKEI